MSIATSEEVVFSIGGHYTESYAELASTGGFEHDEGICYGPISIYVNDENLVGFKFSVRGSWDGATAYAYDSSTEPYAFVSDDTTFGCVAPSKLVSGG
jgi:hypothetical protein